MNPELTNRRTRAAIAKATGQEQPNPNPTPKGNTKMKAYRTGKENAGAFEPCAGNWYQDRPCRQDMREESARFAVAALFDVPVDVELYHDDGRAITGDLPPSGTFVAVRSSTAKATGQE